MITFGWIPKQEQLLERKQHKLFLNVYIIEEKQQIVGPCCPLASP